MQYTHLGRTGLKVSRLCLGTMNFGGEGAARRWRALTNASSSQPASRFRGCSRGPQWRRPSSVPARLEQLDASLAAFELELEAGLLAKLDELFPGYQPSPEAFAW